jgi:hypothetical protein
MYNDNGSVNQAVPIDFFSVTNLFINYTIRNSSLLRGSKIAVTIQPFIFPSFVCGFANRLAVPSQLGLTHAVTILSFLMAYRRESGGPARAPAAPRYLPPGPFQVVALNVAWREKRQARTRKNHRRLEARP